MTAERENAQVHLRGNYDAGEGAMLPGRGGHVAAMSLSFKSRRVPLYLPRKEVQLPTTCLFHAQLSFLSHINS